MKIPERRLDDGIAELPGDMAHAPSRGRPLRPLDRPEAGAAAPVALRGTPSAAHPAGHLVSLVAPTGYEAEQYRILRHTIEQRRTADGVCVVAVTSPGGGEGKTSTAINLAGALAQAPGSRVMLVEADLRQPTVLSQLGVPDRPANARGFAEAAQDAAVTLAEITLVLTDFNLAVVPAGAPVTAPYEVLRMPRVAELIAEARRGHDFVVLDTPPVVPCPDYRVLEPHVDGTLLVVAADRTTREMADAALQVLDPGKRLGLVLNGERRPPHRRGYYYSGAPRPRPRFRLPWLRRDR
jgi:capsular exopolysaccharide synthesis family protein